MQQVVFAGLGNPGKEYERTRHNLGYLVVQEFAKRHGLNFKEDKRCSAYFSKGNVEGVIVHLLLPATYMNNSGIALRKYCDYLKLKPSDFVVVVDDIALPFATMRLRQRGTHGGHNGLRSIQLHFGTQEYARLRMGVGRGRQEKPLAKHVLDRFTKDEADILDEFVQKGTDVLQTLLKEPIEQVMNKINLKVQNDREEESV
ncbi:MAG: aminoacyl-tRNA hydrolase [Waddliaceae bacterium]